MRKWAETAFLDEKIVEKMVNIFLTRRNGFLV